MATDSAAPCSGLERNLDDLILRLHLRLVSHGRAQSAYRIQSMGYRHMVVPSDLVDELSRPFKAVDIDTVLFDVLNGRAAFRTLQALEGDLHDAILDAVLVRNELKQRMRGLRDDKREAGSLRLSD
ncbi:hypothetical protein JCM10296v2_003259 [Rhodotorula toruloides]